MNSIYQDWLEAKADEAAAVAKRRQIEDVLTGMFDIDPTGEKSQTLKADGYKVNVITRLSQSIDADLLQEIAAENGVSDHLPHLFNWKPSINKTMWKQTDESITRPLLGAITTKPGRPTYKITKEDN